MQVAAQVTERSARPFLKWAGGKARMLPTLLAHLPSDVATLRHVEPFVGGGALFFARRPQRALLADVNANLMWAYRSLQESLEGVIGGLEVLVEGGHGLARYEEVRELFNHATLPTDVKAAMMIYLNKTCFNGIYRVNRKGEFNVPPGVFKASPRVLDRENLLAVHEALRDVDLWVAGFSATLEVCGEGDFVYLDPPYIPLSDTANFAAYTQDGFEEDMQYLLAREVLKASKRGAKILLSQSDSLLAHKLYKPFRVHKVENTRSISCDPTTRGRITELLITNY